MRSCELPLPRRSFRASRSLSPMDPGDQREDETRLLSNDQVPEYGPWFDNERRLRTLVHDLEALSLAIVDSDPRSSRPR